MSDPGDPIPEKPGSSRARFAGSPAGGCPAVQVAVSIGDCQADGTRLVTFDVTVLAADEELVVTQLDYGDGLGFGLATSDHVYQRTHAYTPPGPFAPRIVITLPNGCADVPVSLDSLGACPPGCPSPDDITVGVDDCDDQGRRIVWLTVLLPGSGHTTGTVDWQDGTAPDSATVEGGVPWTVTHPYPPPGPHKAKVDIKGCPPIIKAIGPLETCPPPPTPDDEDKEDEGGKPSCRWLRWAFVIFASLSLVAGAMATCLNSVPLAAIAVGAALVAALAFWLWRGLQCPKPCAWNLLASWQISIGTGIGVLHFTLCCNQAYFLGFFLLAIGIYLLLEWKRKCRATNCRVLKELAAVVTGVVLPVVSWLMVIPSLQGCADPIVVAVVDTAAGVMLLAALSCEE